jgi:hypothetical protein
MPNLFRGLDPGASERPHRPRHDDGQSIGGRTPGAPTVGLPREALPARVTGARFPPGAGRPVGTRAHPAHREPWRHGSISVESGLAGVAAPCLSLGYPAFSRGAWGGELPIRHRPGLPPEEFASPARGDLRRRVRPCRAPGRFRGGRDECSAGGAPGRSSVSHFVVGIFPVQVHGVHRHPEQIRRRFRAPSVRVAEASTAPHRGGRPRRGPIRLPLYSRGGARSSAHPNRRCQSHGCP